MNETPFLAMTPANAPGRVDEGKGLPPGATVNPDGSVILALSSPFSIRPGQPGAGPAEMRELMFQRLTGAECRKITRAKSKADAAMAASLRLSPMAMFNLKEDLSLADFAAVIDVVRWLLPRGDIMPDRAEPQSDGGFVLPLLYPVSDGRTAHHSLRFRPLTRERALAAGAPERDKFMANALHHATGLPLWAASKLADHMDAADCAGAQAILGTLMQRAVDAARARVHGRRR